MNKIIDTHLHCWDRQKLNYYWLENDRSILAKNYFLENVQPQLEPAGVSAAILVQATNSLLETDWLLKLAEKYNWVLGAVVWLPLQQPEDVLKAVKHYSSNPFFKGVRHQIHDESDDKWLLQPNVLESLQLLAVQNIPFDLVGIKPAHIETAITVAKKIPALRMVFDHLNQPPLADKSKWNEWAGLMSAAAAHPNFFVKISGLGTTTYKPFQWTANDIQPTLKFVLEHFGANRIFCGGDWPVCLLAGEYAFTWQQYRVVLNSLLSEADQSKLYCQNAEIFYSVKHPDTIQQ